MVLLQRSNVQEGQPKWQEKVVVKPSGARKRVANSSFLITPDTRTAFARFQKHLQELDPLALVWLLMPGPLSRKWRAQAASSLNVHLLTLDQLASNLLRSAGYTQIVLNQRQRLLCLTHLMEEAHREQQLKVLPTPSQTPNLVKYVDSLIQELKQAKISTIEFQNAAIRSGQSRDMDLAHLYSQYEAALESDGSWDAASIVAQTCVQEEAIWATHRSPAYVGVVGYDRFTELEREFLTILQRHSDCWEIYFPAGTDSTARDLAEETARELDLVCPIQPLTSSQRKNKHSTVHVEAPTPEHEVRHVLRQIKRRHLDENVPLWDFTVCLPDFTTYEPLMHSCADEYGIPLNLKRSLSLHPLAQTFHLLLHLSPSFLWHSCWDVLGSPFVKQSFFSAEELRDLRQITQRGQVLEGLQQWERALKWGISRARPDALPSAQVASLWDKLNDFFAACQPPQEEDPLAYLTWIASFLPEEGEGPLILTLPAGDNLTLKNLAEHAWVQIQKIIQRGKSELALQPISPSTDLRIWLWEAMEKQELQIYDPSKAVQITSFAIGWHQPTTYLFALGLNEGVLPRIPDPGPLFTQQERLDSPLQLPTYDAKRAQLQWAQLLANCDSQITMSRPTSDAEMREISASVFWSPVGEPLTLSRSLVPPLHEAASQLELATALLDQRVNTSSASLQRRLHKANRMADIIAARLSPKGQLGTFEGHFTDRAIHTELKRRFDLDTTWSASSLQDYARCPMGFLAKRILELQPETQAASELDIVTKGLVLHDILNRLLRWVRDSQLKKNEDATAEILAKGRQCVQEAWRNLPDRYHLQPYPLDGFDLRQLENLVLQVIQLELEDTEWQPFHLEWEFGNRIPEEVFLQHDEREYILPLRGIVDRIDKSAAGHLRVVDYKSRAKPYSQKDIEAALNTQIVLYALVAARQGWGTMTRSGFRMLLDTTTAKLKPEIDWTAQPPLYVSEVQAALCRQQDAMRLGVFPAAPAHFAGANDRCSDWCELAEFCQPSPESRRKAERAFST